MQNLLEETQRLLRDRDCTLAVVAEDTGVKPEYVRKISAGLIPNPGVRTIQKLHDYLAERERALAKLKGRNNAA